MTEASSSHKKPLSVITIKESKLLFERKQYLSEIATAKWLKSVPRSYVKASKVLECVEKKNLTVIQAQYHLTMKPWKTLTRLVETAIYHQEEINYLLEKFHILDHLKHIDKYLLIILITELLWIKLYLPPNACTKILYYEADLLESFTEAAKTFNKLEDSCAPLLPVYVRINTVEMKIEEGINAFLDEGWKLLPSGKTYADHLKLVSRLKENNFIRDFHVSELLVFPSDTVFYNHPGHLSGQFIIQDKGSCLSSFLLNPKPGSRILDMCAAPGIKTNHLASIINNEGVIFACDNHPDRYNALCEMVQLTNMTCVETVYNDCTNWYRSGINYILVDAPCTYSGIFYNRERKGFLNKRLERSFRRASKILRYALQSFTSVKRVVFTSCSKFPEEAERVVDDALQEVGKAYSLLDTKEMLWNQWRDEAKVIEYPCRSKCLRIKPQVDLCQGYFIAVFERNPGVPIPQYISRKEKIYDEDEDENDDENTDDEISEDISEKNKHRSFGSNNDSKSKVPILKKYHYKPYNKHFSKSKQLDIKSNGPKSQASTSSTHWPSNNSATEFVCETTHNQLYP